MKLWIVTELYYPELTSTGYYLTKIAEGLSSHFEVKVICGQPNYLAKGKIAKKHEFLNGVEIFRLWGTRFNKNIIALRLVNMFTFGLSVLFKSLSSFSKSDQIVVVTTPPNLPFIVALGCLVKGSAYTLLIHDNYPEVLVASGKLQEKSILVRLANFFNRWLYKNARKIIVVGRDMLELLKQKTKGLSVPLVYIPNWAELETIEPRPKSENQLLERLNLKEKFVLLYAGNMGYPNDIESIVESADILRNHPEIHFIFLGDGAKRKWLEREVNRKRIRNITILDPKPRSEQIEFLNACDVGLVSLAKGMWGVSVPSRTYNLLAAGKPILAIVEKGSEVDLIIQEGVGWRVEPSSAKSLAETIMKIFHQKSKLKEISEKARHTALSRYSLQEALRSYYEALKW